MDEFSFIRSIQPKYYYQSSVQKGIGDDAAVLRIGGKDLVTAADTFVEGVHFTSETMELSTAGYRVLAANISDLAAMGAKPLHYLVSIVVPPMMNGHSLEEIYSGMASLADRFQMDLIGGDTVQGKELVISVTVFGVVDPNKARYRHLAKPGDVVFVTGFLGDSRAGLEILLKQTAVDEQFSYLIDRHRYPQPRIDFSLGLQPLKRVALNDVSDGIASELNEIAEASNVRIDISFEHLPIHKELLKFAPSPMEKWVLFGGEDFELVGSIPPQEWDFVQKVASVHDLAIKKIGSVRQKSKTDDYVYLHKDGYITRLYRNGYNHFGR